MRHFSYLAQKLKRNIQDFGWSVTVEKSLAYFVSPIFYQQIYRIYCIELLHQSLPEYAESNGFTFRILNAENKYEIEQIESFAEWLRDELVARIEDGAICLAAFKQEKLAGFNLISFGDVYIPLVELNKTFRKEHAWSEHITVHKNFRKKGLAIQLRYRIFSELKKRGFKRLYGGTLSSNLPALKLARSVGFKELVDIDYMRVLCIKRWRYKRIH